MTYTNHGYASGSGRKVDYTPPDDPRAKCLCHIGCTVDPHLCSNPCRWPACLSEEEQAALADECRKELTSE